MTWLKIEFWQLMDINGLRGAHGWRLLLILEELNIMKMYKGDLPDELPDPSFCFDHDTAMKLTERYPIRWYDIEVEQKFARQGRPLDRLPFRSTIYVLGTRSNISCSDPNNRTDKKSFHPIAFLRSINPMTHRYVTKKIKKDFGITNI